MAKSWRIGTHRDGVEPVLTGWNIQWLSATAPDSKRFQLLLSSVTRWCLIYPHVDLVIEHISLNVYIPWWDHHMKFWCGRTRCDGVEYTVTECNFMETWRHGDMETWRHGYMETWRHGDMETWRHGDMETWRHGDMKTWIHGYMDTWRHGDMETWRHGYMETWRHGDMDTWRHGDMETWRHGEMETRRHGDMETWRHGDSTYDW